MSLLSHQVLLQNLYDILLEDFVKGSSSSESQDRLTPVSEPKASGFLRYISMQNLAIILDLLLDSYRTARDFDTRPGLKYLLMKVSGVCGAANLYRQSAMSFNIYFQVLCACIKFHRIYFHVSFLISGMRSGIQLMFRRKESIVNRQGSSQRQCKFIMQCLCKVRNYTWGLDTKNKMRRSCMQQHQRLHKESKQT